MADEENNPQLRHLLDLRLAECSQPKKELLFPIPQPRQLAVDEQLEEVGRLDAGYFERVHEILRQPVGEDDGGEGEDVGAGREAEAGEHEANNGRNQLTAENQRSVRDRDAD